MTLQQLKYILAISETGSMNKAAEQLYVSQPSLTSSVQELEKETGIKIFNRSGRGVTLTNDGAEFLQYARQVCGQFDILAEKYILKGNIKKKFGVSTQHYSFAVKAFVEMVKDFDTAKYEFAIRETKTRNVIEDVGRLKSEIGVLYISVRNEKALRRLMTEHEVEFHPLIKVRAYVYLWGQHPLATEESIDIRQLEPYPCLSFEQDEDEYYLAEEILSENEYPRTIRVSDRSTMLNLMVGLNGYTLCSGIISGDLNGDGYVAIPFREDEENPNSIMEIGYITKKNSVLSRMGEEYIRELKTYIRSASEETEEKK